MTTQVKEQEIKKLEEKQEWWWVAEKKRSKRLDFLRKGMWKKGAMGGNYPPGFKLDLEYPTLFTEMWHQCEGDPIRLRRAKANSHALDNISLFITDNAQLVGYLGSAPHTMEWRVDGADWRRSKAYQKCRRQCGFR